MRYTDGSASTLASRPVDEGPLAALQGSAYGGRFCAWRGISGQRYVASVLPLDAIDADLDFEPCVLIAVGRKGLGRRVVDVTPVERASDWRWARTKGRALGAIEWHVHMLAVDPTMRADAAEDLRQRHCLIPLQALCA